VSCFLLHDDCLAALASGGVGAAGAAVQELHSVSGCFGAAGVGGAELGRTLLLARGVEGRVRCCFVGAILGPAGQDGPWHPPLLPGGACVHVHACLCALLSMSMSTNHTNWGKFSNLQVQEKGNESSGQSLLPQLQGSGLTSYNVLALFYLDSTLHPLAALPSS